MCIKVYHSDLAKFLSAPGLAWQAALKQAKVKLELLTDIDMQIIVEKDRQEICHVIHRYVKANNKCMKEYDKNKNRHLLNIGTHIVFMVGQCRKNF